MEEHYRSTSKADVFLNSLESAVAEEKSSLHFGPGKHYSNNRFLSSKNFDVDLCKLRLHPDSSDIDRSTNTKSSRFLKNNSIGSDCSLSQCSSYDVLCNIDATEYKENIDCTQNNSRSNQDNVIFEKYGRDVSPRVKSSLPKVVLNAYLSHPTISIPHRVKLTGVIFFVDVSGYVGLAEKFSQAGASGVENLARHLNKNFTQLLEILSYYNGDTIKFCGDALLVLFHDCQNPLLTFEEKNKSDLASVVSRAVQCGIEMQNLSKAHKVGEDDVKFSVRTAICCGDLYVMYIGDESFQIECLISGPPLGEMTRVLQLCQPGQVVVSKDSWKLIQHICVGKCVDEENGIVQIRKIFARSLAGLNTTPKLPHLPPKMLISLIPYIKWPIRAKLGEGIVPVSEFRTGCIFFMFISSGLDLMKPDPDVVLAHKVLCGIQRIMKAHHGFLHQFVVDDKGVTLIGAFGVASFFHENNSLAACSTVLDLRNLLHAFDIKIQFGVATGQFFSGAIGSDKRQEYTVVGNTINRAARLAAKATSCPSSIVIDSSTQSSIKDFMKVKFNGSIVLKGHTEAIDTFTIDTEIWEDCPETEKMPSNSCTMLSNKWNTTLSSNNVRQVPFSDDRYQTSSLETWNKSGQECSNGATWKFNKARLNVNRSTHRNPYESSSLQHFLPRKFSLFGALSPMFSTLLPELIRLENDRTYSGAILIEGGPGMGKTSLLKEIGRFWSKRGHFVMTKADPIYRNSNFHTWIDIFEQLRRRQNKESAHRRSVANLEPDIKYLGRRAYYSDSSIHTFPKFEMFNGNDYWSLNTAYRTKQSAQSPTQIYSSDFFKFVLKGAMNPVSKLSLPYCETPNATIDSKLEKADVDKTYKVDQTQTDFNTTYEKLGRNFVELPHKKKTFDMMHTKDVDKSVLFMRGKQAQPIFTGTMLVNFLRDWMSTRKRSLVIAIDDVDHMDYRSWNLIFWILRRKIGPILIIVSTRHNVNLRNKPYQFLVELPSTTYIYLSPMNKKQCEVLICQLLKQSQIEGELLNLVFSISEGAPFFIEELVFHLADNDYLTFDEGCIRLKHSNKAMIDNLLPFALHNLLVSRFDRLSQRSQVVLKVGSVFGRSFKLRDLLFLKGMLIEEEIAQEQKTQFIKNRTHQKRVHPDFSDTSMQKPATVEDGGVGFSKISDDVILPSLRDMVSAGILVEVTENTYEFKNQVWAGVVYNLMLPTQQRLFHLLLAKYYEKKYKGDKPVNCELLAYHYLAGHDIENAIIYLELSGDSALRELRDVEASLFFDSLIQISDKTRISNYPVATLARWHMAYAKASVRGRGLHTTSVKYLNSANFYLGLRLWTAKPEKALRSISRCFRTDSKVTNFSNYSQWYPIVLESSYDEDVELVCCESSIRSQNGCCANIIPKKLLRGIQHNLTSIQVLLSMEISSTFCEFVLHSWDSVSAIPSVLSIMSIYRIYGDILEDSKDLPVIFSFMSIIAAMFEKRESFEYFQSGALNKGRSIDERTLGIVWLQLYISSVTMGDVESAALLEKRLLSIYDASGDQYFITVAAITVGATLRITGTNSCAGKSFLDQISLYSRASSIGDSRNECLNLFCSWATMTTSILTCKCSANTDSIYRRCLDANNDGNLDGRSQIFAQVALLEYYLWRGKNLKSALQIAISLLNRGHQKGINMYLELLWIEAVAEVFLLVLDLHTNMSIIGHYTLSDISNLNDANYDFILKCFSTLCEILHNLSQLCPVCKPFLFYYQGVYLHFSGKSEKRVNSFCNSALELCQKHSLTFLEARILLRNAISFRPKKFTENLGKGYKIFCQQNIVLYSRFCLTLMQNNYSSEAY